MHTQAFKALPPAAQLATMTVGMASAFMPVDVIDFLNVYEHVKCDFAMSIMIAMLRQPSATKVALKLWRDFPADYNGLDLYTLLELTARSVSGAHGDNESDDPPLREEMEQLNRQGVARFFGVATTLVTLGVLNKTSKCNKGGRHAHLGLEQTYVRVY